MQILSCHVELSKVQYNNARKLQQAQRKCKPEYTVQLESFTVFQEFVNSIKNGN